MKAQILLSVAGAKHLIAKALIKRLDFTKRIYIAYGSTNQYFLFHLGFSFKLPYIAGMIYDNKLNVTEKREKIIVLKNRKIIDISEFDINEKDIFLKGANALWYEGKEKKAAVLAADKNGGTYGNFYIKATTSGSKIIIPVGHEKLIPFYYPASQNVDMAMGNKVALLEFFKGEVYTEIEAFKDLFNVKASIIAAGGIGKNRGSVAFEIEGEKLEEVIEFANKYNDLYIEETLL